MGKFICSQLLMISVILSAVPSCWKSRAFAGILAADSPQKLSKDCELPIGSAKIIWNAAGGTKGGLAVHTSCLQVKPHSQ